MPFVFQLFSDWASYIGVYHDLWNKQPWWEEGLEFYSQLCSTTNCITSGLTGPPLYTGIPSKFWVIAVQLLGSNKSTSKQRLWRCNCGSIHSTYLLSWCQLVPHYRQALGSSWDTAYSLCTRGTGRHPGKTAVLCSSSLILSGPPKCTNMSLQYFYTNCASQVYLIFLLFPSPQYEMCPKT